MPDADGAQRVQELRKIGGKTRVGDLEMFPGFL